MHSRLGAELGVGYIGTAGDARVYAYVRPLLGLLCWSSSYGFRIRNLQYGFVFRVLLVITAVSRWCCVLYSYAEYSYKKGQDTTIISAKAGLYYKVSVIA